MCDFSHSRMGICARCDRMLMAFTLSDANLSGMVRPVNWKQVNSDMPLKNGKLTRVERKFSETYAATGDATYSGTKAGYALPHARASEALQRPAVQAEIRRIQTERLFKDALPLAVTTLCSIMADERQAAGARVQASKIVLDRTLGDAGAASAKEPHEMSPDELAKAIADAKLRAAALEHVAADRAKPILDHEPQPGIFD